MINNELRSFIEEHKECNTYLLALQSKQYPNIDMRLAVQQIQAKQIASEKIPLWYHNKNIAYPKHISMEQCSSQATAIYKVSLCKGTTFVDLTGGLGVDFSFMSQQFEKSTYVESQPELVELAQINFKALDLHNVYIENDKAENYLLNMQQASTIYIDPARRNDVGKKTVFIDDCSPNLKEIDDLLNQKANQTIIKLSPMLDISNAINTLTHISEIHIVSCNNECKELLLIKNKDEKSIVFYCINIINENKIDEFTFSKFEEATANPTYTQQLEQYFYEPNASVLKAGAYKSIAIRYNLKKININSHLYTSDQYSEEFPGRKFRIISSHSFNKEGIKEVLSHTRKANITVRNFPLSVAELRKKIKMREGGDIYIFATTIGDNKKILVICEKTN